MAKSTRRRAPAKQSTGTEQPRHRQRPGCAGQLRGGDALAEKAAGTQDVASAFPFNAIKSAEYDPAAALTPPEGPSVKPADPIVGASTVSESNGSEKTGSGGPNLGHNPTVGPLDRVRVDSTDRRITTNQGVPVADNQSSLKAGLRGPTLLEDFILREKITHFDHERIPERIVHARGSAAHGYFECSKALQEYTRASLFAEVGKQTPVFVRFSTVLGERGSTDTARDVRGFAVKFYTDEGNWDLVGNNIPVFFIQDAMKFPDLVHAAKPEPHFAMPQAGVGARHVLGLRLADAGDHPHADVGDVRPGDSAQLPDDAGVRRAHLPSGQRQRGIALRQVPLDAARRHAFAGVGRGGQDFRCRSRLPPARSLGSDRGGRVSRVRAGAADLHRGAGRGVHLRRSRRDEDRARGARAGRSGRTGWCSNRNPDNFFAETEQVAFCVAHVVPGIDFSNDPLLAGRIHSYVDTQISRLGGPNFHEIPINAPVAQVHNNQRDGMHRQAIHRGRVSYEPNSLGGGCPFQAGAAGFVSFPEPRDEGDHKVRGKAERFADHYTQATLFWNSQTDVEKQHIINAFRFELSRVQTPAVRERMVSGLMNVDADLATAVATGLGIRDMPAPMPKVLKRDVTAGSVRVAGAVARSRGRATAASVRGGSRSWSRTGVTARRSSRSPTG